MQDGKAKGNILPIKNNASKPPAEQFAAPRRGYRRQMTPEEESVVIFRRIHLVFGAHPDKLHRLVPARVIQGIHAILRMARARFYAWRENEWPAYFVAFRLHRMLARGSMRRVKDRRRVFYRGHSTWNVRLHCARDSDRVILGDVVETNAIFDYGGFGLIVLEARATYDVHGTLRQWHDQLKGGPSAYTRVVAIEGRRHSLRKESFSVVKGTAYYFPTLADFRAGLTAGWLNDHFGVTMREPNGEKRPHPKYMISLKHIPWRFRVAEHDFDRFLPEKAVTKSNGGENHK